MLKLLEEDEEFRLMVAAKLGILDIHSMLKELMNAVNKLIEVDRGVLENQDRMLDAFKGILENLDRLWQEVRALREGQEAMRNDVSKLWEENRRINENIEKLWQEVKVLREGQSKLWEEVVKIWGEIRDMRMELRGLRDLYGGLSKSVGSILEMNARHYLPVWVRNNLGLNIGRLRRFVVRGVVEVDGYAEVNGRAVVVEIKATLRLDDVLEFVNSKLPKIRESRPGVEVIPIIVYVNEAEDTDKAIKYARKSGVKVLRHIGEDEFEEA